MMVGFGQFMVLLKRDFGRSLSLKQANNQAYKKSEITILTVIHNFEVECEC